MNTLLWYTKISPVFNYYAFEATGLFQQEVGRDRVVSGKGCACGRSETRKCMGREQTDEKWLTCFTTVDRMATVVKSEVLGVGLKPLQPERAKESIKVSCWQRAPYHLGLCRSCFLYCNCYALGVARQVTVVVFAYCPYHS